MRAKDHGEAWLRMYRTLSAQTRLTAMGSVERREIDLLLRLSANVADAYLSIAKEQEEQDG